MSWGATHRLVQDRRDEAAGAPPSQYRTGYLAALDDLLEEMEDEMWAEGEDLEEEE